MFSTNSLLAKKLLFSLEDENGCKYLTQHPLNQFQLFEASHCDHVPQWHSVHLDIPPLEKVSNNLIYDMWGQSIICKLIYSYLEAGVLWEYVTPINGGTPQKPQGILTH